MAYGRPGEVRSHRRARRRGNRKLSRGLAGTLVAVLAFTALAFGYSQLLAQTCTGQETIRVLASPATARHLSTFATDWTRGEPSTSAGTCARVQVETADSAQVAGQLAAGWDSPDDPPHVWVPAATAWAQLAAASDLAEQVIPDLLPSIARTPTVIAMPEPMAQALGWPQTRLAAETDLRWETLLEELGGEQAPGWAQFDQPQWGEFRFGMGNPARDTASLLALTAILDASQDGETSPAELENAFVLSRLLDPDRYHETTDQLLNRLGQVDAADGEEAVLAHVSAFPALEQEVLAYNRDNRAVPLAAVYPVNGNIEADHPYLILNADWVTDDKREVAEGFLAYVRSADPQEQLREAGFRGTNREPGSDFVPANGLLPQLVALPRAVLVPESVTLAMDRWTALTRPMNVLMVFDVSGSMLREIPGLGEQRMERAQAAATTVVELFADEDRVGFWEFSTALDGELDYRSLVALGQLDDVMDDGRPRRAHVLDAVDGLVPAADTGLYHTIAAAYDAVLDSYDPDALNLVVVITDGEDDTGGRPGISLDELLGHLQDAPGDGQQVRVSSVAFGEEADFAVMQEISQVTGGQAHYSDDGFDLAEVLRAAVFSTLP